MILPFKKILCPTDFSLPSYIALEAAIELVDYFDAELHVIHAVPPLHVVPVPANVQLPVYEHEMRGAAEAAMKEVLEQRVPKHLNVHSSVMWGEAAHEIVEYAKRKETDLIVIATHGHTGWRHLMFGSVTEKVVRLANHPVLTIHQPKEDRK
jgi:nucleotide-binding universal stress UspA family protein